MVQGSLIAVSTPYYINPQTLAIITEIIRCESSGDPNAKNPNSSASGLTQLINSTVKLCEENLKKDIDPFNPKENVECARWLLSQPNGENHWNESRNCWEPHVLTKN